MSQAGAFDPLAEAVLARQRIVPHLRVTPLDPCPVFDDLTGAQVLCKLENLQPTGSFKVRGALNKILSLDEAAKARGIMTASSGNHGAATAFVLGKLGAKGTVYLPENAAPTKIANIRRRGGEVRQYGLDNAVTETHARKTAAEEGMTFISPYNDPQVMAGQGTIALELLEQDPTITAVFVGIGGGGLSGGVASVIKRLRPDIAVYGCSASNSKVMMESVKAGRILDLESLPTISDGTAGGVEEGSITFEYCRDCIDHFVEVSEEEIISSLRSFITEHHMMIEGAAALPLAAMVQRKEEIAGGKVVAILSGANIGEETLLSVLSRGL